MKKVAFLSFIAAILITSCNQNSGFKTSKKGLKYKIVEGTTKDSLIKVGDIVKYSIVQKFGDSLARNSEESGNGFAKIDSVDQPFAETEIMKMMKVGDSAMIKISTDSIYKFIYNQAKENPNFNKADFEKNLPKFFTKKNEYVTVGIRILKKYAVDSLAMKDFELEKPKMQAYQQKMQQKMMAEQAKKAEGAKATGNKFLEENKKKPGVVTTASGLQYQVVKAGTGPKPVATDNVKVNYIAALLNGTEVDNSAKQGRPAEFRVTGVIPAWIEVLQLMPVGSKYKVWAPSNLAYGDQGSPPAIGPGETLAFDIELLDIVKAADQQMPQQNPQAQMQQQQAAGQQQPK